ncbi:hypothetical protein SPRG_09918 [Saprolegnia parasitica CBS 223.65]|uniref:diacylglycerol O-acyltransferase n=1 Tax=Saprolegnia parasitica (strain CBS 223.65) TaxID=695850 RepID=A0A067CCM1_SAPPC|nr:hypothetical protein SPRG_09918 [Saprolegnia parasitica CBS 223.65]KDO24281.1 hypothetical protein SPRG_09918 [Saprolegnia parasitica CBS 223.65]|eukprot:XP_012205052.1 hypothetical protein SPRG_09918 [Saprolegnia parasitica CBS 223.65]
MFLFQGAILTILWSAHYRWYVVAVYVAYASWRFLFPLQTWPLAQRWMLRMNAACQYFPSRAVVFEQGAAAPPPDSKAMLAYHPHGILAEAGTVANGFADPVFAPCQISWLVSELLFLMPPIANIISWFGCGPVHRANFESLAKRGSNLALIPGGFEEATIYAYGKHRVFLKERKGFIKLALQHGYKVYPVYTFGEERTYLAFEPGLRLRLALNRFKLPGVLFRGLWWCFFLPFASQTMTTVVGAPLQLPTLPSPTPDDVRKYHDAYMTALQALFERHKAAYAQDPTETLEFF